MRAIILFAHGARDPDWARPLEHLCKVVSGRAPDIDVRLAFLEFMSPSLAQAIDEAVGAGAERVDVVPVFLAQGGHVRRDVPLLLQAAQARHPALQISLREALGESPAVIEAMADCVLT